MKKSQRKGQRAMNVAVCVLLFTWIILLALLAFIYILRLQGYNTFAEWQNRDRVQEVLSQEITGVPQISEGIPTPSVTQQEAVATATPEPTLPPVKTMVFSGKEAVDRELRAKAEELFGTENEVCYITYENGVFFSTVFQKGDRIVPLVYNLDTGEAVTGSNLIKETYFAIIKERLQSYMIENFPEEAEDEFVSYGQTYQAEDYQKFYLTQDQLVFYFEENTLTDNHPAFSYSAELSEAKAFFKMNLDGSKNGPYIRELDPDKKMIAITFDDGPYPKVEKQILELFERYNARATFFFLGHRIDDWYPDTPAMIYEAGHEVASHTYSHTVNFALDSAEKIWSEVNKTNLVIAKATGYAPDYIRFPGGSFGKTALQVPMIKVNWNLNSVDYAVKNQSDGAQKIYEKLTNPQKLGDGCIVLLHSIYQNSYDGVELFLEYLVEQGYELVTLSELFYYKGPELKMEEAYRDGFGTPAKSN